MTGPARALCYQLAATTGLRYSEITTILPGSLDWKAPSVTIPTADTKDGDPAMLPLPRDVADDLAADFTTIVPRGEGPKMGTGGCRPKWLPRAVIGGIRRLLAE